VRGFWQATGGQPNFIDIHAHAHPREGAPGVNPHIGQIEQSPVSPQESAYEPYFQVSQESAESTTEVLRLQRTREGNVPDEAALQGVLDDFSNLLN
jgi:hypothetical protein